MLTIIVSLVWVAIIILIKVGEEEKGKDDKGSDDKGSDEPPDDDDEPPDYDDDSQVFIISFSINNLFYESFLRESLV